MVWDQARKHREVVEAILAAGGVVVYDYQFREDGRGSRLCDRLSRSNM